MIQNNILVNNSNSDSNSLRFFSSLCETNSILQPSWGTGPATFSRASAQYITDFEGETRKVESEGVAVEGSRVVTNLLTYSEDLSNAAWVLEATATKGSSNLLNLPVALDSVKNIHTAQYVANQVVAFTVTLSGSGTVSIKIRREGAGTAEETVKTITLSATPTRYAVSHTIVANQTGVAGYVFRNTGNTATSVTVHSAQLENVTGQTNTNPGEYVKTTSAAVTKCFSTTNGNTVNGTTGVVTEATGTSLPTSYSERQNSTAYVLGTKIQVSGWWYNCTTAGTSASSAPTFVTGKTGVNTATDGTAVWTIGGRLLLGYVSEPASTNKTTAYGIIPADTLGSELASGTLTIGQKYQITARTDADFTADGAADNVVGTQFVATAATVTLDAGDKVKRVQWGVGEKSFHNGSSFVQNISGLTLQGDTAAILSIVTDQTEIEKAGLAGINPTYKVYKLDNSAGSTVAYSFSNGFPGNTNKHSYSAVMRGNGFLSEGWVLTEYAESSSVYTRLKGENKTPPHANAAWAAKCNAGQTLYFLLPQLEELSYVTSIMPTAGATATRAATSLSYPTAGNLRGNDVTVGIEYFAPLVQNNCRVLQSLIDSNNYWFFTEFTATAGATKYVGGTEYSATGSPTYTVNAINKLIARQSSSGLSTFKAGTALGVNANLSPLPIGTTLYTGSGSFVPFGYLRNLRIWFKPLSDDRCKQLTL